MPGLDDGDAVGEGLQHEEPLGLAVGGGHREHVERLEEADLAGAVDLAQVLEGAGEPPAGEPLLLLPEVRPVALGEVARGGEPHAVGPEVPGEAAEGLDQHVEPLVRTDAGEIAHRERPAFRAHGGLGVAMPLEGDPERHHVEARAVEAQQLRHGVGAVAAKLGLKCLLVQEKWVDWDDPVNDKVGNILLSRIMGADVRLDPHGFDIGIRQSWEEAIAEVEASGGKPYAIPAGASEHKLGGLGFANWAYEVVEQEKELGTFFDTIVVCTVTGSTHAGMIAGFAALEDAGGRPRRVIGIDASATLDKTREQVGRIARSTAKLIGVERDLRDDEITVLEGWAGDLYGIPVESTIEAIKLSGRLEGMIIDPVYEGKSMAGLIDLVSQGVIAKDSTVLYAHLGGQPALNAYSGIFG